MKKNRNKNVGNIIYTVGLFPFIFHLGWLTYLELKFNGVKKGREVVLAQFSQKEALNPDISHIKVIGIYGDIYQPKPRNSEGSYDMIVVSATIDPLYTTEGMLVWESNMLVRTFFMYAYGDSALAESGFRNLIIRMLKSNKKYIDFLSTEPVRKIAYNIGYAVEICEPFIAKVPESSQLFRDGVRWYAVLPLFNSRQISREREREQKLFINVKTAVMRLLKDLKQLSENFVEYRIRAIAFPALAGSALLPDSRYYLPYQKSFEAILQGIESSVLPLSIEHIYFIAWDKWEYINPKEGNCAVSGLKSVYNKFWFKHWPIKLLGYSLLIVFCFVYLLKRLEKLNLKDTNPLDFLLVILILVISLFGNFAFVGKFITLFFNNILNTGGVLLLLIMEVILGFFSAVLGLKLSTLKFKKLKRIISND
jgi:hypothetical protein